MNRGSIDYDVVNFCAKCKIKYSKAVRTCYECGKRVRSSNWRTRSHKHLIVEQPIGIGGMA